MRTRRAAAPLATRLARFLLSRNPASLPRVRAIRKADRRDGERAHPLMRKLHTLSVCLAAAIAAAVVAAPLAFGRSRQLPVGVDLRRMVVIGDSILAGFGSGGLVRQGRLGQRDSAPALIARQVHVAFRQPLMDRPGLPAPLTFDDVNRNGVLDPGEVRRRARGIGFRSQPGRDPRNLAVPGERLTTVFDGIDAREVAGDVVGGSTTGRELMKFAILGLPIRNDPVSQVSRAIDLSPSMLLVWIGNNDVLTMATRTNPQAVDISAADFGAQYRRLLDRLADARAPMAVATLPDVTGIALLRHPAGEVTTCRRDDGTIEPVAEDALLNLNLNRGLLPQPPCARILDSAEQAFVRGTVHAFNDQIVAAAAETEQRRGTPVVVVDMFALFDDLRCNGADVRGDGSLVLTTRYLGGIFTLDGVHPTRTTHALIANAFIDAINTRLVATIPRVDVARVAARDPFVLNRFRPTGEAPFGVIDQNDDVDVLDDAFADLQDHTSDVIDDIKDFFDDLF